MTLHSKIDFIQKRTGLNDKKFCKTYRISLPVLWQIRKDLYKPEKSELAYLCQKFNLDLDDFMNDSSSVKIVNIEPGEHVCKLANVREDSDIYEDFPLESNDRYEEKD